VAICLSGCGLGRFFLGLSALIVPLTLEFCVLLTLKFGRAHLTSFLLFLQTIQCLKEKLFPFLIQNLTQVDELLRILPLFVSRKNVQGEQLDDPYALCLAYTRKMMAFLLFNSQPRRILQLGLGGGSLAKFCYKHLPDASITAVGDALVALGSEAAADLATALAPFMAGGTYGAFFEGQASLDLDADFTVFEMSDLASREELRAVVLSAIMFMTSQAMTRSPRSVRKLLLIDEAWSMLKGGSMGEFVETYARTCRKYGGALATATQSLNDYYKSDGATAALENSDWMLILQQKPETIADFKASKRLDMDDRTETLIRSLKRSGNDYSEVFIKGPETEAIGRLVLDDYSATLFSSSPQTFAAIDAEIARGHQLADAIERIAFANRS